MTQSGVHAEKKRCASREALRCFSRGAVRRRRRRAPRSHSLLSTMSSHQRTSAELLFLGTDDRRLLFAHAMEGRLGGTSVRGLGWRYFLGALPAEPSGWAAHAAAARAEYAALVKRHCSDPSAAAADLDPTIANPLSTHEESPWSAFHEVEELRGEIMKDLTRLHPGHPFFARAGLREAMLQILVVWAREHPALAYRQGMHELLAPLVMVLTLEAEEAAAAAGGGGEAGGGDDEAAALLRPLLDQQHVEADAFSLFSQLMTHVAPWFESGPARRPGQPEVISPLVAKCRHIGDDLLRAADPEIHARLAQLQVEPQLFLLRWLRLLFGREFHLDDVLMVWDALFAYGRGLVLVDHLSVAMVMYAAARNRAQLGAIMRNSAHFGALRRRARPHLDPQVRPRLAPRERVRPRPQAAPQVPAGRGRPPPR